MSQRKHSSTLTSYVQKTYIHVNTRKERRAGDTAAMSSVIFLIAFVMDARACKYFYWHSERMCRSALIDNSTCPERDGRRGEAFE